MFYISIFVLLAMPIKVVVVVLVGVVLVVRVCLLLEFYVLATSKVISGCALGNQDGNTMT